MYETNRSQTPGACLVHPGVRDKSISDTRRLSRTPGCTRQIDLRHTALVSYTRVYKTKSISDTRRLSHTPGCISDTRRLSHTPGGMRQIDLRHPGLVSYTRVYETNRSQTPGACLIHPGVRDKSISDTRRLSRTPGCTRQIDLRHPALASYTWVYETNRSQTPGACLVHPGVRDKSISDTRRLSRTPGCRRQSISDTQRLSRTPCV